MRQINKSTPFILFLLTSLTQGILAQDMAFEIGYGTYSMTDMKEFQQDILDDSDIAGAKVLENFPGFFQMKFSVIAYNFERFSVGVNIGLLSTGGRTYYADYSGSLRIDNKLNGTHLGIMGLFPFYKKNDFLIDLQLTPSLIFTTSQIESELIIGQNNDSEILDLVSTSITLETGFRLKYNFGKFFVGGFIGANLGLNNGLRLKSDRDALLVDNDGNNVITDWSGFRCSSFVGLSLWN